MLTTRHDLGVSRVNGRLVYDGEDGLLLLPLDREGYPTFINGSLVPPGTARLAIRDGDELGFGGKVRNAPTRETIRYVATLSTRCSGLMGSKAAAEEPAGADRWEDWDEHDE